MKHRHRKAEIAAKLERADAMSAEGRLHSDIAKELGISVMTYHRWRKARDAPQLAPRKHSGRAALNASLIAETRRISELQAENSRLRRLVTDLLLEKMSLEEGVDGRGDNVTRRTGR